jgi:Tfp pilus assembly protein PilV
LGFGIVGVVEAITMALRLSKDAERQTQAALLAAGRLEEIRAQSYLSDGEKTGDFGADNPLYAYRQEIVETETEGLYSVSVAVTLSATDETLYVLETLLFDVPLASGLDYRLPPVTGRRRPEERP